MSRYLHLLQKLKFLLPAGCMADTRIYELLRSDKASLVFTSLVIINTIVLAVEHHGMSSHLATSLEVTNFVLTLCFAIEMMLKLVVFGPREYFTYTLNNFDAFVVVLSVIELACAPPGFLNGNPPSGGGAITALRSLRLFRVFKLARGWPAMQKLLALLAKTIVDVRAVTCPLPDSRGLTGQDAGFRRARASLTVTRHFKRPLARSAAQPQG